MCANDIKSIGKKFVFMFLLTIITIIIKSVMLI